jgi:general secretion pathway protein G
MRQAFTNNRRGFTLIELLVVISIIGFLVSASILGFSVVRMKARDTQRLSDINTLRKSLISYFNDKSQYPHSNGECLVPGGYVLNQLVNNQNLSLAVKDPFWPTTPPSPMHVSGSYADVGAANFCYYYISTSDDVYHISYFIEGNSTSAVSGVHVSTSER